MSMDRLGIKWRRNIAENFSRLSGVHERYRQTTDGRATAYREREREFAFAKKRLNSSRISFGYVCGLHYIVEFSSPRIFVVSPT